MTVDLEKLPEHSETADSGVTPTVSKYQILNIDNIRLPARRTRALGSVEDLMKSILDVGLLQPIVVDSNGTLISGAHRLEACRRLAMTHIHVRILDGDEIHRQLAELDENLMRVELTVLERAKHLARRKEIYEILHPETRHGGMPGQAGGGKAAAKDPASGSFVDETAAKTKRGRSTVAEETKLGAQIGDTTAKILGEHAVADNKGELKRLAKFSAPAQEEIAKRLVSGELQSVPKEQSGASEEAEISASELSIFDDIPEMESAVAGLLMAERALNALTGAWDIGPGRDVESLVDRAKRWLKTLTGLRVTIEDQWIPRKLCTQCDPDSPERCTTCGGQGWLSMAHLRAGHL